MNKDSSTRFSGLADIYAKHRPTYPAEAIDFICRECSLPEAGIIADVGCGTGISSRLFSCRGYQVLGIEPNDDMLSKAESDNTLANPVRYLKGTAESTGQADGSVDLVLCAQAFHWFDKDKALAEFKRILRPRGYVVLMWNERDESERFTAAYGAILRTLPETASVECPRGIAGNALLECPLFEDAKLTNFKNGQVVDEDGLLGRAFSASYAPKDRPGQERLTRDLKNLFAQFATESDGAQNVRLCYITSVYSARRRQ
jgi:SAM-dependent methyltransferase